MIRFWIIEEFHRHKKNPFKQKYFPFYEFLGPETDIMVQLLEPETDVMVQFLAQEIVIMGERNYIIIGHYICGLRNSCSIFVLVTPPLKFYLLILEKETFLLLLYS